MTIMDAMESDGSSQDDCVQGQCMARLLGRSKYPRYDGDWRL